MVQALVSILLVAARGGRLQGPGRLQVGAQSAERPVEQRDAGQLRPSSSAGGRTWPAGRERGVVILPNLHSLHAQTRTMLQTTRAGALLLLAALLGSTLRPAGAARMHLHTPVIKELRGGATQRGGAGLSAAGAPPRSGALTPGLPRPCRQGHPRHDRRAKHADPKKQVGRARGGWWAGAARRLPPRLAAASGTHPPLLSSPSHQPGP